MSTMLPVSLTLEWEGRADQMNKLGCRWRAAEKGAGSRLAGIAAIHARRFLERQPVQD